MIRKLLLTITIYLCAIVLLSGCAEITRVKNKDINTYLEELVQDDTNFKEIKIYQSDITLNINYKFKENIDAELVEDIFKKAKEYILLEETQKLIMDSIKNSYYYRHHNKSFTSRIKISFSTPKPTDEYSYYTKDFGESWKYWHSIYDGTSYERVEEYEINADSNL